MKTLFLIGGMGPRILTIYGMKVCLRSPGTGDHIWEVQENLTSKRRYGDLWRLADDTAGSASRLHLILLG